jgi:hypothetical protein
MPAAFEFASILGVLISVLISLFLAALVVVAALSLRSQNAMGHSLVDHPIKEKSNINLHLEDLYEKDDKNPDVIPCPKGKTRFQSAVMFSFSRYHTFRNPNAVCCQNL